MNSDNHQLKKITKSIVVETKKRQATVISNLIGELIQSTTAVKGIDESFDYSVGVMQSSDADDATIQVTLYGTPLIVGKADAKVCLLIAVLDDYIKASL